MKTRKVRCHIELREAAKLLPWMRESNFPFRAKLKHQKPWVRSLKSSQWFATFVDLKHDTVATLDLHILRSDYPLLRIKLRFHSAKIIPYVEKKPK